MLQCHNWISVSTIDFFVFIFSENRHGEKAGHCWRGIWGKCKFALYIIFFNCFIYLFIYSYYNDKICIFSRNLLFVWLQFCVCSSLRVGFAVMMTSPSRLCVAGDLTGWLERWTSWTTTQISWQNVTWLFATSSHSVAFHQSASLTAVHIHRIQLQTCPRWWKGFLSPVFHILQPIR